MCGRDKYVFWAVFGCKVKLSVKLLPGQLHRMELRFRIIIEICGMAEIPLNPVIVSPLCFSMFLSFFSIVPVTDRYLAGT